MIKKPLVAAIAAATMALSTAAIAAATMALSTAALADGPKSIDVASTFATNNFLGAGAQYMGK